jgi:hypothetical protein
MNGAANKQERYRIAAAAGNQQGGGPPDAPPVVLPSAAPAAAPVIIGAAALAQILADVQQQHPSVAAAGAPLHECAGCDNGVNYSGRGRGGGRGTRGRSGNGRSERREGETDKCWICDSSSHQKSACPVWDKALTLAPKESGVSSASNRRTGGSGGAGQERANYRGRSTSGRRPSNNALSTTAPARTEVSSPVPEGADS